MVDHVRERLPALAALCHANGVCRLWLFGSATGRGTRPFTSDSDVDLIAEFDPTADLPRGFSHPLFALPDTLSDVIGRPVHLAEAQHFRNPCFRKSVEATKELLYDRRGQEAALGYSQGRCLLDVLDRMFDAEGDEDQDRTRA